MVKPVFPLIWDPQPVPPAVKRRIEPSSTSKLTRLGSALFANALLSFPLLKILSMLRDLTLYTHAYKETPTTLCHEDHDFMRIFNYEVEHQLVDYVYTSPKGDDEPPLETGMELHPVEAVTKTACICYLNVLLIVSPPASGLSRALANHLKNAIASCTLPLLSRLSPENYGLLAWASFIGAQESANQPEQSWFIERLARIAMIRGWRSWEQMSDILTCYFYAPSIHEFMWRSIWDRAIQGLILEGPDL